MKTDVAIVGGGPGGAAQAMFLARHGVRTAVIEMDSFPRYHIGESMTGECGAVVRRLGLEEYMLAARWPRKQGVKVYGEGGRNSWWVPVMQRTDAGDLRDQETWQVRRDAFDAKLLSAAESRGAAIVRGKASGVARGDDGAIRAVRVDMADGGVETVECDVCVDASGQKNFFVHTGVSSPKQLGRYDTQIAIFSQFANTVRDNSAGRAEHPDNTLIFYSRRFHWAWFIPLDDQVVSVGVVLPASYFKNRAESKDDFLLRELREMHPELSRRLPDLTPVEAVRAIPNYSYDVTGYAGANWLCLGDAHRFIDPIFSFGLYLSMREAELATPPIVQFLNGETRDSARPFAEHQRACTVGVDRLQHLIDGFWAAPLAFAFLVNGQRTRVGMLDLFAGRIYGDEPENAARRDLRLLAEKAYPVGGGEEEPAR
jgi:flavin-dependent dehydrogenase